MQYWIIIKTKKTRNQADYDWYHHHDCYLPGTRVPERVEPMLTTEWVDKHFPEWCPMCELAGQPHPIKPDGSKYCTVLLHDAVKPDWRIKDIV